MNNEIKVGDKVRVREDAPSMFRSGFNHVYTAYISKVLEVDDGNAIIEMTMANMQCQERIVIPTKYLVKVDAEAKEAKYKAGDKVRVKGSVLLEGGVFSIIGADYHEKLGWRYELNIHEWYPEIDLELYTEPTEQTEAVSKPCEGISEETANEISDMLEAYAKTLSGIADSFDWQRYEADLAKEVVLKTVNSASDRRPSVIAQYATDIAKSVVEGLTRK